MQCLHVNTLRLMYAFITRCGQHVYFSAFNKILYTVMTNFFFFTSLDKEKIETKYNLLYIAESRVNVAKKNAIY